MSGPVGVYTKKLTFEIGEGETHVPRWVYIALIKGTQNVLVDTGTSGNFEEVAAFCKEHGVDVGDIDLVINTHCHPDHIGGNLRFRQANPRITFCAHPADKPEIEDVQRQFRRRPLPGFDRLVAGSVEVDRLLEDGDTIDLGMEVRVLHTPGHSAGEISLHLPDRDLLIIGDSVPGRSDVPIYEDVESLRESIDRLDTVGASNVISAFDGECGPVAEVARLGRGVLDRVDQFVKRYLAGEGHDDPTAQEQLDPTRLCRYVLDQMGFTSVATIPIIVNSVMAHLSSSK